MFIKPVNKPFLYKHQITKHFIYLFSYNYPWQVQYNINSMVKLINKVIYKNIYFNNMEINMIISFTFINYVNERHLNVFLTLEFYRKHLFSSIFS